MPHGYSSPSEFFIATTCLRACSVLVHTEQRQAPWLPHGIANQQLGYPLYIISLIGVTHILGGLGLLIPNMPRLTEWVCAGLAINLSLAFYSQLNGGGSTWDKFDPILVMGAGSVRAFDGPTQAKRGLAMGHPIWWRDTGAEARVVAPIESCADYKDGRKVHAARWVPALPQCVFYALHSQRKRV